MDSHVSDQSPSTFSYLPKSVRIGSIFYLYAMHTIPPWSPGVKQDGISSRSFVFDQMNESETERMDI